MTESTASLQRPQNVTLALRILWFFLIANVIFSIALYATNWDAMVASVAAKEAGDSGLSEDQLQAAKTISVVMLIVIPVIVWVLCALFYTMIGKGKNWARIVLAVLTVLGLAWLGYELSTTGLPSFEVGWFGIYNALKYLGALASLVALVLLFSPSANPWFHQRSH